MDLIELEELWKKGEIEQEEDIINKINEIIEWINSQS